jgi:hypothetical protein
MSCNVNTMDNRSNLSTYRSDGDAAIDVGGAIQRIKADAVPEQQGCPMPIQIRYFSYAIRIFREVGIDILSAEGTVDEYGLLVLFRHKNTLHGTEQQSQSLN